MLKFIFLIFATFFTLIFQNATLASIEQQVYEINNKHSIKKHTINSYETDGGAVLNIYTLQNEIIKIEEEIGLSFGRVSTTIYLEHNKPIKILETEENFRIKKNNSEFDYTSLHKVFGIELYVFDWNKDVTKLIKTGERVLSEGNCGLYEYEPLVKKAIELLKNQKP